MFRCLLTDENKILYDQLNDDTLWWRRAEFTMWIETREVRPIPDDVEYSYAVVQRMFKEGLWDFEGPNTVCLWIGNGPLFLSRYESGKEDMIPLFRILDRHILWFQVKKRLRREKKDKQLKILRKLRGQDSENGYY